MGSQLCVDQHAHSLLIYNGDSKISYDYEIGQWPNDQYLKKLLQNSEIGKGQKKQKPYQLKFTQKYYWGGWSNGKPKGKGIFYINQSNKKIYYQGQVNGQPNGKGKLIVNQGQWEYEGQVVNGQANGNGKMLNKKQGYTFDGQWIQSKPVKGELNFYKQRDQKLNINCKPQMTILLNTGANQNTIKYADGRIYTGQIQKKNFTPHCIGKVVLPDKSQYLGQWQLGKMHGLGKFQWSDGSCYNGDYFFGQRSGTGKFVFNNGNYYNGSWTQGKQNGQGALFNKNGEIIHKGIWKKGQFIGSSNKQN